jgi:hypothetical protein
MADQLFAIEGRLSDMADVQRTWQYELEIPNISEIIKVGSAKPLPEELLIRCRSVQLPERGNETIESYFGSMKQLFPGKPTMGNDLPITFEETTDQLVLETITAWQQLIMDIRTGKSHVAFKRAATRTIFLNMYAYDGSDLKYRIKFVNAWPRQRDSVPLEYNSNDSVKYNTTFAFDLWDLVKV